MGTKDGAEEREDSVVGCFVGNTLAVDEFFKLDIGGDLFERQMHDERYPEFYGVGKYK